jgi:hypothetical protein
MVYYKIETNLYPSRLEMWECFTNKGNVAALPRRSYAGYPKVM